MKVLITILLGFLATTAWAKSVNVSCTFEVWLQAPSSTSPALQSRTKQVITVADPILYQGKQVGASTQYQFQNEFKMYMTVNFANHPFDQNRKEIRIINTEGFWEGADGATTGNDLVVTGRQHGKGGSYTNIVGCNF